MTVAHKDLTGTDLHEIKGASTAGVGEVPIANGSGSTAFGKLTASSLTGTANSFGGQLLHVREEQNAGVPSTGAGTVSWNSSPLNVVKTAEIAGASISAGNITLPAGTYYFEGSTPVYVSTSSAQLVLAQARLFSQTAGVTILTGQPSGLFFSTGVATVQGQVMVGVAGRFTLGTTSVISLQTYSAATAGFSARPLGVTVEVYADIKIWKVA
jgi:hypothetical protein